MVGCRCEWQTRCATTTRLLTSCLSSLDVLMHTEESWRVLLRKTSVLLLRAIAAAPEYVIRPLRVSPLTYHRSQYAPLHLNVLQLLLSSAAAAPEYTQYVLGHGFYSLLGQAIQHIVRPSACPPANPTDFS